MRILVAGRLQSECASLARLVYPDSRHHLSYADTMAACTLATTSMPDLLLLDAAWPHESGVDVCRRLRATEALHDAFVVLLTADTDTAPLTDGYEAGADAVLRRPLDDATLDAVLHLAAQRQLDRENRAPRDTRNAAAAHELSNQLLVAQLSLDIAEQTLDEAAPARGLVGRAGAAVARAGELLNTLQLEDARP